MSVIKVKDLKFTYPAGVQALKGVNLEVDQGEVLAIIGQNGSGKTTLVKHFNGLLKPSEGEVLVNNEPTRDKTTAQLSRSVGYVFQDPDDQIFMDKVFEEVGFGPKKLGWSEEKVKKSVKKALKQVGLWGSRNEHPLDLSLNDKKLVAIASIISMDPEVIILDEPTTGQDHEGITKVETIIEELSEDHTVILISHNMSMVSRVASRIVVMYDGSVLTTGPPKKVFVKNKLLEKTYLKPPLITQLAQNTKGVPRNVLSVEEFVQAL